MNLPFFIGLRYTGAGVRTQLVAFLARVSMLGLVVGVGLLLAVLSIMNGFDKELRETILGLVPQAAIYRHGGIEDWQSLQAQLQADPRIEAAAPFVQASALVAKRARAEPVLIYGIDPAEERRVSRIEEFVSPSALERLATEPDALVLGKGVAEKLALEINDAVMVLIPDGLREGATQVKYFTLVEFVSSGTELDNTLALTNLTGSAALAGMSGAVSGMRLKVTDLFRAHEVVWETLMSLGGQYYGSSWENTHGNLYHAIHLSKRLVALLMFLIVAIAAFNVVSTLIMVVVEKESDIAILQTLGASSRTIMTIFMVLGTAIGLMGTFLGVAFGVGLSYLIEPLVNAIERITGARFLNSDVYPLTYLPTEILASDVTLVVLVALAMSFLATLYPAWRASKVLPAEALRYE